MIKNDIIKGLELIIKGLKSEKQNDYSVNILKEVLEFLSDGCYFVSVNNIHAHKDWKITLNGKKKNVRGMFVMPDDLEIKKE